MRVASGFEFFQQLRSCSQNEYFVRGVESVDQKAILDCYIKCRKYLETIRKKTIRTFTITCKKNRFELFEIRGI